jgi:hypothetical protein
MDFRLKVAAIIVMAAALAGGAWFLLQKHSLAAVELTLHIGVAPAEESGFVIAQVNSARFKYLMGKQTGVKPVLAQKLEAKLEPSSSRIQARLKVAAVNQARRYAEVFLPTLQEQCGARAQLTLVEQSIR